MNRMKAQRIFSKHIIWPLLITIMVAVTALSHRFDAYADSSVDAALKRSLVTFGVARGLNAVISVAQGTEVNVTPFGMGITLAPGEVLDPVNDLIERFSGFMMVASVALGTQKVLLGISGWVPYSVVLVLLGFTYSLCRIFSVKWFATGQHYLWKLFIVLAVVRFLVPLAIIGSEWMYSGFLQSSHDAAEQGITHASSRVSLINQQRADMAQSSDSSSWQRLKNWAEATKHNAATMVQFERYGEALKETAKDVVQLIVVFFLCTFAFPVIIALALWKLTKWALSHSIPDHLR